MNASSTNSSSEYNTLPGELLECEQWMGWLYGEVRLNGKRAKEPLNPRTLRPGNAQDPANWSSYKQARQLRERGTSGEGFVFTAGDPFTAIDMDDCIDKAGKIMPPYQAIVKEMDSYTEITPSGHGLRIIVVGEMPEPGRRIGNLEVYSSGHFLTMTGQRLSGARSQVMPRQPELQDLYTTYFKPKSSLVEPIQSKPRFMSDDAVIMRARKASNGGKFMRLMDGDFSSYPSQSEADLALAAIIAFYTQNIEQIERIFSASRLGDRAKWRDVPGYRFATIQKALLGLSSIATKGAAHWLHHEKDPEFIEDLSDYCDHKYAFTCGPDGRYILKDSKTGRIFSTVQVFIARTRGLSLVDTPELLPSTYARWRVRMTTELGHEPRPFVSLPELPSATPPIARMLYESFGLLLECDLAYSRTEEVTPQPFSVRFALLWCGTTWGSTQRGLQQLRAREILVDMGKDGAGNLLYLPKSSGAGGGLSAIYPSTYTSC